MKVVNVKYYNRKIIHNAICLFHMNFTYYISFIKNGFTHNEKYYAEVAFKLTSNDKSYYYYLFGKLYYRTAQDTNKSWKQFAKKIKLEHKLKIFK